MPSVSAPLAAEVAVMTGSTSGIGRGVVRALAAPGASTAIDGLTTSDKAEQVMSTLYRGCGAIGSGADLTCRKAVEGVIQGTLNPFGRFNIQVNYAGVEEVNPSLAVMWNILGPNLSVAFHATRLRLPAMRRRRSGSFMIVTSASGVVASSANAAFAASTHSVIGLTKAVSPEVAKEGITFHAICLSAVRTLLVEAQIDAHARSHAISREQVIRNTLLARQPNKNFATVETIGVRAVFLAESTDASNTRAAWPIDRNWTAH
jgi:3-hydroxybutyrate dehydrogenase